MLYIKFNQFVTAFRIFQRSDVTAQRGFNSQAEDREVIIKLCPVQEYPKEYFLNFQCNSLYSPNITVIPALLTALLRHCQKRKRTKQNNTLPFVHSFCLAVRHLQHCPVRFSRETNCVQSTSKWL